MSKSLRDRLSQVLLEKKIVTEKDLKRATEIHAKEGGSFGWILVREGIVTEKDLMSVMSNAFNVPVVNLSRYKIEKECVGLIPEKVARQYRVIAICKLANTLIVAMADPLNIFAIDDLKVLTNFNIEPVLSTETDILQQIDNFYISGKADLSDIIQEQKESGLEIVAPAKE